MATERAEGWLNKEIRAKTVLMNGLVVSCWGFSYRHIIFEGDIFTVINLLNIQETNLNIKTISHTIFLWNNCFEEIEFMHQKGLEMMCRLLSKSALQIARNKITGELRNLWQTWRDVDAIREKKEEDCRRCQDNMRRKHRRCVIPKDISYKESIRVVLEDFTIDGSIKLSYVSPSKFIFGTKDVLPLNSHSKKTMNEVKNMCCDMHIKYLTFLRDSCLLCLILCIISEEVVEMEHGFVELQKLFLLSYILLCFKAISLNSSGKDSSKCEPYLMYLKKTKK
ncbi:hypothetical protein YC2023_107636 [Brassica napus]